MLIRFVLVLLCLLVPCPLLAWEGRVVSVTDGDLLTALHEGREEKLRLFGVDTPDEPQDFGRQARELTSGRVLGKMVEVTPVDQDRHGNTVAIVSVGGESLNRELVRSGLAWVYSGAYCNRPECKEWKAVEMEARQKKVGLWSAENPTAPWDFRRSGGNALPAAQAGKIEEQRQDQAVIYHGDIVTHIYHAPGCPQYNCKGCIADFKGKAKAQRAGYKPCPVCSP